MSRRVLIAVLIIAVAGIGCVAHRMYREDSVVEEPGYTLAFIEFDDRGEIWSPRQVDRVQRLVRSANRHEDGSVVIVLAHGWNNDASLKNEKNGTLAGFKATLERVARGVHEESPGRPVLGVYLGWRGKSMVSPFTYLTFYSRQRAAERVAGPQGMAILSRIILDVKANPESSLLLIGHSFGGRIVERIVQQGVAASVAEIKEGPAGAAPDLTVILNPASPATNAKQVIDLLRWGRIELVRTTADGRKFNVPLLVSLTSAKDKATRVAYRIGSVLGLATSKFRTYGPEFCSPVVSQRRLYARTAGHTPALHSHRVRVRPRSDATPSAGPPDGTIAIAGEDVDIEIEPRLGAYNDTPYWIMRVPPEIMANHYDTWNPNLVALLGGLLEHTGALEPGSQLSVVRDDELDPVFIVPWTSDSLWLVDRSRRVLDITDDRSHGVLVGCVPEGIDLANVIGYTGDAGSFVIVQWRTDPRGHGHHLTEIDEIVLTENGFECTDRVVLEAHERFFLAVADRDRGRVYLVTDDDLVSVDYRGHSPRPEFVTGLSLAGEPTAMDLDHRRGRLFLLDGAAGRALELDLANVDRGFETAATGFGPGAGLAVDPTRGDLVVVDPASSRLCRYPRLGRRLGAADVDPLPEGLHEATFVRVSKDGSLWVGDLVSDAAFQFSAQGELTKVLD